MARSGTLCKLNCNRMIRSIETWAMARCFREAPRKSESTNVGDVSLVHGAQCVRQSSYDSIRKVGEWAEGGGGGCLSCAKTPVPPISQTTFYFHAAATSARLRLIMASVPLPLSEIPPCLDLSPELEFPGQSWIPWCRKGSWQ